MRKPVIYLISALLCAALSTSRVTAQELVIVHFNDTHSHLEPERSGEESGLGGVIERAA